MKICRIPYENLKTLFIKSINYDRGKYRYYRESIKSIMAMGIEDEAKVHAIWFMGIVYNNALNVESATETNGIVTEGLPIKISDLVKDKLNETSTDFKELLKGIESILTEPVAADEADLSGEIKLSATDKIIWGHPGLGKTTFKEQNPTGVLDFDTDFKPKVAKKLGLPANKQNSKGLNEWRNDSNKAEFEAVMREVWKEAVAESKRSGKMLVVSDMLFLKENLNDFDKIITTSKETFIKRTTERGDNPEILQSWKSSIDKIIAEIDQSKVIFTNKYFSELAAEGKPEVKGEKLTTAGEISKVNNELKEAALTDLSAAGPKRERLEDLREQERDDRLWQERGFLGTGTTAKKEETKKPLTTAQKLNNIFTKLTKASDATLNDLFAEFEDVINKDALYDNSAKINAYNKFLEAISKVKNTSATSLRALIDQKKAELSEIEESASKLINVRAIPSLGEMQYVRKKDGQIKLLVFKNDQYFVYSPEYTGENESELTLYTVEPTDYITPVYGQDNLEITNSSGSQYRLNANLAKNGVGFEDVRIYEQGIQSETPSDNRTGNQKISDSLSLGVGLANQIKIIADRRRILANRARVALLNEQGYPIDFETGLTPTQFSYLASNPNAAPVVTNLMPRAGLDIIISSKDDQNWDYLMSLDTLGFVYPDGTIRFIDWTNNEDLKIFKEATRIKKYEEYVQKGPDENPAQAYTYEMPTDAEIENIKNIVAKIKEMKSEILEMMDEDTVLQIPHQMFSKYFDISNVFSSTDFVKEQNGLYKPVQTLDKFKENLVATNSLVPVRIAQMSAGKAIPSSIREENIIGIVKKDALLGFIFEPSIEQGYTIIDENNEELSYEKVFEKENLSKSKIADLLKNTVNSRYNDFYLLRTKNNEWILKPMYRAAPVTEVSEVVNFLSTLGALQTFRPEFSEETADALNQLIRTFNNRGWGFNAYKGISANIDFLRIWNDEPVFGVRFRASGDYAYAENLNKANLSIEFSFDYYDIQKQLNILYRELNINPKEYSSSVENMLRFGNILQAKIEDNKHLLTPTAKKVLAEIENEFKNTISNLNTSLNNLIEKESKKADKNPENKTLVNPKDIKYLLFRNLNTLEFKLASRQKSTNPLLNYKVFEHNLENSLRELIITPAKPSLGTAATVKTTTVATPVKTEEKKPATIRKIGIRPDRSDRANSLVTSLNGLSFVASKEIQKQIDDVKRMLGSSVKIDPTIIADKVESAFVLGYIEDNVITLNKLLPISGVIYHEAFHAVFRLALTTEERLRYLEAAKTILGSYKTDSIGKYLQVGSEKVYLDEFRKKRNFAGVEDNIIVDYIYEEYLADGFRDYKLNKSEPKNALIKMLYSLLDGFINLFKSRGYRDAKNSINDLYGKIDKGEYADVIGDKYAAPRAYALSSIPTSLIKVGDNVQMDYKQVDNYTTDQLVDRITREMLKRSGDIVKGNQESFNQVYDEITRDLINYFNINNFITDDNPNSAEIIATYEPMFRNMRFMMGAAHRTDVNEDFILDNLTDDLDLNGYSFLDIDGSNAFSYKTYEEVKQLVQKSFGSVGVIKDKTSEEDQTERDESDENEDDSYFDRSDEDEMGENFEDGGILTYKPYEGSIEFQKLIKYIKYTFVDERLGVAFDKMVNSRDVINQIRKITYNTPKENIIEAIYTHIQYLKSNIDNFNESGLASELGYIREDMIQTIDDYNTLKAVYETLDEQASLHNFLPTRSLGMPFYNMFVNVFYRANKNISAISINTNYEEVSTDERENFDRSPVKNSFRVNSLIQRYNTKVVLDKLRTNLEIGLESFKLESNLPVYAKLKSLVQNYNYVIPTNQETFDYTVNRLYTITSYANLNIPRNVIEFAVAASVKENYKEKATFVDPILAQNKKFLNAGNYFNIQDFIDKYNTILNSLNKTDAIKTSAVNSFMSEYESIVPFAIKYDPSLVSNTILNQDNKPINQSIPYVPSVQILNEVRWKGLAATLLKYYGDTKFFEDNPTLAAIINNTTFNPNDKSQFAIDQDTARIFFENFDISVAGGMFQEFGKGNRRQSTYKALGDKGYALSVLGLFANRFSVTGNYGQEIIMFEKPITQLEATSTQFNMTSLYDDYTNKKTRARKVKSKLKQIIKQEYNRIANEWSTRDAVKIRYENYNCRTTKDRNVTSSDLTLRAYNFNRLKGFFERDYEVSYAGEENDSLSNIHSILKNAAIAGTAFEDILSQTYYDANNNPYDYTVDEVLSELLFDYAEDQIAELAQYFKSIDIQLDDIPSGFRVNGEFTSLAKYDKVVERKESGEIEEKFYYSQDKTAPLKDLFIEDFGYNFWFNSLEMNQLFDGDLAVGVDNVINFFKRQKSGVIAGNNYRNINILEANDNSVFAVFKGLSAFLDSNNPGIPLTTDEEMGGDREMKIADGQGWSGIDRRIKKFRKDGILSPELEAMLKKLRYTTLSTDEIIQLNDNGIFLGSDKPAVGHPYFYYKDSEHYINRSDNSFVSDPDRVAELYEELDALEMDNPTYTDDALARHREIIKEIHSYFKPKLGRAFNHHLLNALEYFRVDVAFDDTVSKKGTVQPLIINMNLLENNILEGHGEMTFNDSVKPVINKDGYINLEYNAHAIPNDLVYEQVSTAGISKKTTDSIQKKLILPAQLDHKKFPGAKKILDLQLEIVKSRLQLLERVFKTDDPKTLVTKAIQAGLMKQGAGENLLKFYSLDTNNKNKFNLNLSILGKQPMFYFFSLFNNSIFGPKVAGKKFYHVSVAGYQLIVDENDKPVPRKELDANPERYAGYKRRYPTVKETYDENGKLIDYVVEVIIPRELASTKEEVEFFEKLYTDFLAARIPTADKRSMVRAKVVDYIDATYGNSIIVPSQVHFWAGSDLDIDALYAETYDYYRNTLGKLVKYGDYSGYTKLGLSKKNAEFLEYLHYMATDPVFADLVDSEQDRINSDQEFKTRSLANAVGLFGDEVREFFSGTEDYVLNLLSPDVFKELSKGKSVTLSIQTTNDKNKKKGTGLESLGQLMGANVVSSNKSLGNILKLMDRLIAVVNVINNYNLPSTPDALEAFTKKEGNPVHSRLHNEILLEKMELLGNPDVYETYIKNADGEKAINEYKADRKIVDSISDFKGIDKSDPYQFQTVGRIRSVNNGTLDSVSANANQVKSAALIGSSNVKLSKAFTFKFVHNGKAIETNKPIDESVQKMGGATDVSLDDAKHQSLAPLKISKINAGVVGALYIYGYPSQFARLINSVDLIASAIKEYSLNDDPSYSRSISFRMGFSVFLNNKTLSLVNANKTAFEKFGVLKPSKNKINKFEIDHSNITIEFNDVESGVEGNTLDNFNITIKNNKGEIIAGELGSIVLMSFYNEFLKVGNAISFKIGKLAHVIKKLRPSFRTLSGIKDAVDFIENNEIFENAPDIFKQHPYLEKLAKDGITEMSTRSKEVLLDETNLFKAFTSLFRYDKSVNIEDVVLELKSILGLSSLNAYVQSRIDNIDENNMSQEDVFVKAIHDATSISYWQNNKIEKDLNILKRKFPKNEFLKSLTIKPALVSGKGKTKVITSLLGGKLSSENQNRVINDFYQLLTDSDESVYKMAVNVAVHGIVKDGGISRNEGFLKIIAPDLFIHMSKRLDIIQDKLYKLDTQKGMTSAKYIKGLNDVFKEIYSLPSISKDTAATYTNSILRKLVSTLTKQSIGNGALRLSFYPGSDKYLPGKYSDISLTLLKSIVDTILPKNKDFIYTVRTNPKGIRKILPVNAGINTKRGLKGSNTRFELWKADSNNELMFDLSGITDTNRDVVNRLLLPQGIYQTRDGNYSFPLYQINNFNGDQVFLLTELDGKPFTTEFFANLFDSYKSTDEFQFLLRGTTAKYVVVDRQGADRISPNAFRNDVATEIKKLVDSTSNVNAPSSNIVQSLPSDVKVVQGTTNLRVDSKTLLTQISGARYVSGNQILNISSVGVRYSARNGKAFMEGKSMNEQQLNEFANKLGFSSYEEATKDTTFNTWLNSKSISEYWLIPYAPETISGEVRKEDPGSSEEKLFGLDSENDNTIEFHINTLNTVSQFLETVGVQQRLVPEFLRQDGSVVQGALAAANFVKGTVDIIDDINKRPAAWNKMPEEAAHWWYRLLKTNSPLKDLLWKSAKTGERLEVLLKNQYGEEYESVMSDNASIIDALTEESIGQLIGEAIKKIEEKNGAPEDYSFLKAFVEWINKVLKTFTGYFASTQDPFEVAAMKILTSDMSDLMTMKEYAKIHDYIYFADKITEASFEDIKFDDLKQYGTLANKITDIDEVVFSFNVRNSKKLLESALRRFDDEQLYNIFPNVSMYSQAGGDYFERNRGRLTRKAIEGLIEKAMAESWREHYIETTAFDFGGELLNWLLTTFPEMVDNHSRKLEEVKDDRKFIDKLINDRYKKRTRYLSKTIDSFLTIDEIKLDEDLIESFDYKKSAVPALTKKLTDSQLKNLISNNGYEKITPTLKVLPLILEKYGRKDSPETIDQKVELVKKNLKKEISNEQYDAELTRLENKIKGIPISLTETLKVDGLKKEESAMIEAIKNAIAKENPNKRSITAEELVNEIHNFLEFNYALGFANEQNYLDYRIDQTFSINPRNKNSYDPADDIQEELEEIGYDVNNMTEDQIMALPPQERMRVARILGVNGGTGSVKHNKISLRFNDTFHTSYGQGSHFHLSPSAWANLTYFYTGNSKFKDAVLLHEIQNDNIEELLKLQKNTKKGLQDAINDYLKDLAKNTDDRIKRIESGKLKEVSVNPFVEDIRKKALLGNATTLNTILYDLYSQDRLPSKRKHEIFLEKIDEQINLLPRIEDILYDMIQIRKKLDNYYTRKLILNDIKNKGGFFALLNESEEGRQLLIDLTFQLEQINKRPYNADQLLDMGIDDVVIPKDEADSIILNSRLNDLIKELVGSKYGVDLATDARSIAGFVRAGIKPRTEGTKVQTNMKVLLANALNRSLENQAKSAFLEKKSLISSQKVLTKFNSLTPFQNISQEQLVKIFENMQYNQRLLETNVALREVELQSKTPTLSENEKGFAKEELLKKYEAIKEETEKLRNQSFPEDEVIADTIELELKYFAPLVHYTIQKHIKNHGKAMPMYFSGYNITNLTQGSKSTALIYAGKDEVAFTKEEADYIKYEAALELDLIPRYIVKIGEDKVPQSEIEKGIKALAAFRKTDKHAANRVINQIFNISNDRPIETGAIYNAMTRIPGIKLVWQPIIPGIRGGEGGYLVDLSNYNYSTPLLYALEAANKQTQSEQLSEDNDPFC